MIIPKLITVPFARDASPATRNEIPNTLPAGTPPQNASWTVGFPSITMQPLVSGGQPPNGQDFNGVLNAVSEHTAFLNGGGSYKFSADWVTANGGYDKGSILLSDDGTASYISAIDGNTDDFNSDPASIGVSWLLVGMPRATTAEAQDMTSDMSALTPKKLADAFKGGNQSLGLSGYQKIAGGLIFQWGRAPTISNTAFTTVTLPIAFPNEKILVIANPTGANLDAASVKTLLDTSKTTFGILAVVQGTGAYWIALGR